jgi:hypothetical protein
VEGTQFKQSELTTAQEKLIQLKERLAPYERELNNRQPSSRTARPGLTKSDSAGEIPEGSTHKTRIGDE